MVFKRVNERWNMDFKGPFILKNLKANPPEPFARLYFLIVIDYFSKYAWAKAFEFKFGAPIAEYVRQLMLQNGTPESWQSDNGGEFCNEHMKSK